jgi:hypothetical protein
VLKYLLTMTVAGSLLVACGTEGAPAPSGPPQPLLSFDETLVSIVDVAPGFAGFYRDQDQVLVILLADPVHEAAARREVSRVFGEDTANARIRTVKYDFRQLATWKSIVSRDALRLGLTFIDADEFRNVVAVGVRTVDLVEPTREFAMSAGIPPDAIEVVQRDPFVFD